MCGSIRTLPTRNQLGIVFGWKLEVDESVVENDRQLYVGHQHIADRQPQTQIQLSVGVHGEDLGLI